MAKSEFWEIHQDRLEEFRRLRQQESTLTLGEWLIQSGHDALYSLTGGRFGEAPLHMRQIEAWEDSLRALGSALADDTATIHDEYGTKI